MPYSHLPGIRAPHSGHFPSAIRLRMAPRPRSATVGSSNRGHGWASQPWHFQQRATGVAPGVLGGMAWNVAEKSLVHRFPSGAWGVPPSASTKPGIRREFEHSNPKHQTSCEPTHPKMCSEKQHSEA